MGITSNDIAAQRAMLQRGEEKRKADWKQAERERLRDTFAAAALTGLVASNADLEDTMQGVCEDAYSWADAMLRERGRPDRPQPVKPADATPDTNATPTEGSVQNMCTLTVEEREAVDWAADFLDGRDVADTLRNLLERLA
jgi:hypothetical protein